MTTEDGAPQVDAERDTTPADGAEPHAPTHARDRHAGVDDTRQDTGTAGQARTTRRAILGVTVAGLAGVAGCSSSGDQPPEITSTPTDEGTPGDQTSTDEDTTTDQPHRSFGEIYDEQIAEGESGLLRRQAQNFYDRMENEDYESFSHLLEDMSVTIAENSHADPGTQQFTNLWKYAVHNDLELSSDDIRIFGRDTAGGGTYTAIFHKNDDGDWVKDLAFGGEWEEGYLRHNETGDEVDHNHESEAGLWDLWIDDSTLFPGTHYSKTKRNYDKEEVEFDEEDAIRNDRVNDHIVVGEPFDEATVDYTVPAAEAVEAMMNWHENDTFNEEMAMVEQATKAYHNSEEPYIEMRMVDGEVTAVPTEEHHGPDNLYG